ncbi:MAG: glucoamylase family protein [Bacteroidales bacterium]
MTTILRFGLISILSVLILSNCQYTPPVRKAVSIVQEVEKRKTEFKNDDDFLTYIQKAHFNYMWEGAEINSGLAREQMLLGEDLHKPTSGIVTIGNSGFGIAGLIVGMERGFITRQEGLNRFHLIVDFLMEADRFHGMWPRRLDGITGKMRSSDETEKGGDVAESALLMQGLLCARQYFNNSSESERSLVNKINKLWHNMEWKWYQNGTDLLFSNWSPEHTWEKSYPLGWDNGGMIAYVLGASSPTYPISTSKFLNLNRGEERIPSLGIPQEVLNNLGELRKTNPAILPQRHCERCASLGFEIDEFPYMPDSSMKQLKDLYFKMENRSWGEYGFMERCKEDVKNDSVRYNAFEQVKIAPVIENYRSELLWRLFMSCPEVKTGIANLNYILKPKMTKTH